MSERSILERELWKPEQRQPPSHPQILHNLEVLGGAKSTMDTIAPYNVEVSLVFLAIQLKHLTIPPTESLIISYDNKSI